MHLMDIYLADPPDYLDQRLLVINAVRLVHVEFCLLGIAAVELMSGLNRGSIAPDKPESIGIILWDTPVLSRAPGSFALRREALVGH